MKIRNKKNTLDSKKKKQIQEFINVTESNEECALKYLKDSKWNFDQAIDSFFTNPPKLLSKTSNKKIDDLFNKYKGFNKIVSFHIFLAKRP